MLLEILTGAGVSRIYTESTLREIGTGYRLSLDETTFQSVLFVLVVVSALSLFKEKVFLNWLADFPVSRIEAWIFLYKEGFVPMQPVSVRNTNFAQFT
jgi:hypothetical protein